MKKNVSIRISSLTKYHMESLQFLVVQRVGDVGDIDSSSVLAVINDPECALSDVVYKVLELLVIRDKTTFDSGDMRAEIV